MGFIKKFKHIGKRLAKLPRALWKTPQTKENLDIVRYQLDSLKNQLNLIETQNHRIVDAYGTMLLGMQKSLEKLAYQLEKIKNLDSNITDITSDLNFVKIDNNNIKNRLEFIRKEIFFEIQKILRDVTISPHKPSERVKFKVLNEEKIKNLSALRLNLGCGHIPKEGFVNIDFRELPGVDVIADVGGLDFEKGSVDTIYASHLIEHFSYRTLEDSILPHWYALLKKNGNLTVLAPDAQAMIKAYTEGSISFQVLREVMYGTQEYDGDFHFNLLTAESTVELLKQIGFSKVNLIEQGRRNGLCYEFEIQAIK
ncbi:MULTISPECIES: class I SAM-dependent methyltransferase [Snodgrassella]|uniref:class I SAM-dependent methyltransferase n=1 Tax=Snodgrassella TaxID=1193515 RepID=UPI000815FA08|nr:MULTISPECIES: hypothetical protein [Snodgrassella]SCC01523.1 hypothetical protein GA0061082_10646 [Snodgrassella sp. R-53583]